MWPGHAGHFKASYTLERCCLAASPGPFGEVVPVRIWICSQVHTSLEHRHEPCSSFILIFSFVMNIMDSVRPSTLYMWYLIYPHFRTQTLTLVAQTVKHLPAMQETWIQSLGWEDPLEKEMATHSSTLAWKFPSMKEPGRLQSMGLQRVGHD